MKAKLLLIAIIAAIYTSSAQNQLVDYRYAPQWHETLICMPDDTCKTLVGPLGQLLYEYGGKYYPYSNNKGFNTTINLFADEKIKTINQKLYSSKVPIVITESSYGNMSITQEAFAIGLDFIRNGISTNKGNREDIILTKIKNNTNSFKIINPVVIINSKYGVKVDDRVITINNINRLVVSENIENVRENYVNNKTTIELESIEIPPHQEKIIIAIYDNGKPSEIVDEFKKDVSSFTNEIPSIKKDIIKYWEENTEIPYGYVQVPDKEIQNVMDASLRGIWQAREIKGKDISFQVGPTCYRGLWIVDGAFILETAAMFGRKTDSRQGIEYMLSFQEDNGKFGKMTDTYWKENGIVLWACVRHAMLTQDKDWLKSIWPKLNKTFDFIKSLRKISYNNNIPLDDGLIPPGDIDGGLWGGKDQAEYSSIYWNLIGLKSMIQAAVWIDDKKSIIDFGKEYNDFFAVFQKAAKRDMLYDSFGNKYLPIIMDTKYHSLPQRAQWAFCQAVYPGQIFKSNDSIVTGNLDMLRSTLQEGIVNGTGWMEDGIWTYFASFYGHACLWAGDGVGAYKSLYSFANHASPLYSWREEQNPRDIEPKYWGDMPHNWGSAEFARLVVHLLAIDKGNELHLLEGIPKEWLLPGMNTSLNEIATPFGKLTFHLQVDDSGKTAELNVKQLINNNMCEGIFVHLRDWGIYNGDNQIKLNMKKDNRFIINLK